MPCIFGVFSDAICMVVLVYAIGLWLKGAPQFPLFLSSCVLVFGLSQVAFTLGALCSALVCKFAALMEFSIFSCGWCLPLSSPRACFGAAVLLVWILWCWGVLASPPSSHALRLCFLGSIPIPFSVLF
ncbi:hypothetical protein U1Q18_021563 [Sarracenia purpurea var. burkii]